MLIGNPQALSPSNKKNYLNFRTAESVFCFLFLILQCIDPLSNLNLRISSKEPRTLLFQSKKLHLYTILK